MVVVFSCLFFSSLAFQEYLNESCLGWTCQYRVQSSCVSGYFFVNCSSPGLNWSSLIVVAEKGGRVDPTVLLFNQILKGKMSVGGNPEGHTCGIRQCI